MVDRKICGSGGVGPNGRQTQVPLPNLDIETDAPLQGLGGGGILWRMDGLVLVKREGLPYQYSGVAGSDFWSYGISVG